MPNLFYQSTIASGYTIISAIKPPSDMLNCLFTLLGIVQCKISDSDIPFTDWHKSINT